MRARGRLDHSETDVLSRLSVEKQWVPRLTLARLFHVLSKISVPKKMYCSNDEITYHFEAQEPEDYARLGI